MVITKPLTVIAVGIFVLLLVLVGFLGYDRFFSEPSYQQRISIILDSVEQLSVLTSTRYTYSNLVTSEREMPGALSILYGERLVLVAIGHVTAGVDLSQLTEDDIVIEGDTIHIQLPPAQLQDCFLNEAASYVVSRDTGVFSRSAPQLDTAARRFAVQQFRDAAIEQGILDEAGGQAGIALGTFIDLLRMEGISTVDISTTPSSADAERVTPDTCL